MRDKRSDAVLVVALKLYGASAAMRFGRQPVMRREKSNTSIEVLKRFPRVTLRKAKFLYVGNVEMLRSGDHVVHEFKPQQLNCVMVVLRALSHKGRATSAFEEHEGEAGLVRQSLYCVIVYQFGVHCFTSQRLMSCNSHRALSRNELGQCGKHRR
jgi:hypothetical protein